MVLVGGSNPDTESAMTSKTIALDPEPRPQRASIRITEMYPAAPSAMKATRLLVVDDDEDLRNVFDRIARSLDPDLVMDWAGGVDEAIPLLGTQRYTAVIADYLLRGTLTGLTLRAHTRRRQPCATFAMMSACPMRDVLASLGSGPHPFLRKPFSMSECRQFVKAVLYGIST